MRGTTDRRELVVATANVLTHSPAEQKQQIRSGLKGLKSTARLRLLHRQYHDSGVHLVGVQEARLRAHSPFRPTIHSMAVVGGVQTSNLGVANCGSTKTCT